MSARGPDTSSKRKRTTPQKLKNRKIFAASRNDIKEQSPQLSKARDGEDQENQLFLSELPETLQNKENVPKTLQNKENMPETPVKKENMTETPQNKENMPEKYPTGQRGRGRPKGSKNKTFPTYPTRVYSVREGKSPVYASKLARDGDGAETPHRGRGRPKGSTKVKRSDKDTPKRSRGRPKGSKNKKPSKTAVVKFTPGSQKMVRGRPRKTPQTGQAVSKKRGRGRPKGSLNKIPSPKKLAVLSETQEVKKRGRPKKNILHHTSLMPLTPKRPRGRPKSSARLVVVPIITEVESSESNTQDEEEVEVEEDDDYVVEDA